VAIFHRLEVAGLPAVATQHPENLIYHQKLQEIC
jgi:hypothetical protein